MRTWMKDGKSGAPCLSCVQGKYFVRPMRRSQFRDRCRFPSWSASRDILIWNASARGDVETAVRPPGVESPGREPDTLRKCAPSTPVVVADRAGGPTTPSLPWTSPDRQVPWKNWTVPSRAGPFFFRDLIRIRSAAHARWSPFPRFRVIGSARSAGAGCAAAFTPSCVAKGRDRCGRGSDSPGRPMRASR